MERAAIDPNRAAEARYEYGSTNLLTRVTDAEGGITEYEHDLRGKLTALVDAKDNGTSYEYDAMGRVVSATDAGLRAATYAYDWVGNRTHEYDGNDNRIFMTNPYDGVTKKTSYTYDALNRLKSVTDPDSNTVTYTYDPAGRKIAEALPGGAVTGTYLRRVRYWP